MEKQRVYSAFGARLASFRRRARLSQGELGKALGFSRTSITNIETGRQAVQLHTLYEMASLLAVNVRELLPAEIEVASQNVDADVPAAAAYLDRAKSLVAVVTRANSPTQGKE